MRRTILGFTFFFCSFFLAFSSIGKEVPQPVAWDYPLPKVRDMGIDLNTVKEIIGEEGQFIFTRDPQPVTSWTIDGVKTYPDGFVTTAMKIIHQPVEKVREVVKDFSRIPEIQSQHKNVELVSQRKNHTLYSYDQVYKMAVITLKCRIMMQQTLEEDGSISIMLHKGDVDAQILRWDFIALDEDTTLLALTFWSAYSTARFSYKVLLSVLPYSHLGATTVFCSLYLQQYAEYIDKDWIAQHQDNLPINKKPVIPLYTKELSPQGIKLIESLVSKGSICIRKYYTLDIDGEVRKMAIGSIFNMIDIPFEQADPIISDIDNLPDSIPYIVSMKKKSNTEGIWTRSKYRFGKFPIMISLTVQQIFYKTDDPYLLFENPSDEEDLFPYAGAYEWSRMGSDNNATLYIFTHTLKNGPNANFLLRVLKKVMPDIESIEAIGEGIVAVEARKDWIEKNHHMNLTKR